MNKKTTKKNRFEPKLITKENYEPWMRFYVDEDDLIIIPPKPKRSKTVKKQ